MKNDKYSHSKKLKSGYKKINEKLLTVHIYTETETIQALKSDEFNYTKWFGKSANRKLIIANLSLYKSILHHTEHYPHLINFRGRLILLAEYDNNLDNIKCKCGDVLKYNANGKKFTFCCKQCKPPSNSLDFFKMRDGDEIGVKNYNKMKAKSKISRRGFMGKEWFIAKYGNNGEDAYIKHYEKNNDN